MKASTTLIIAVLVIVVGVVLLYGAAHTSSSSPSTEVADMNDGSLDRTVIEEDGVVCYTFEDDNRNDPEYTMSCLPINETTISR